MFGTKKEPLSPTNAHVDFAKIIKLKEYVKNNEFIENQKNSLKKLSNSNDYNLMFVSPSKFKEYIGEKKAKDLKNEELANFEIQIIIKKNDTNEEHNFLIISCFTKANYVDLNHSGIFEKKIEDIKRKYNTYFNNNVAYMTENNSVCTLKAFGITNVLISNDLENKDMLTMTDCDFLRSAKSEISIFGLNSYFQESDKKFYYYNSKKYDNVVNSNSLKLENNREFTSLVSSDVRNTNVKVYYYEFKLKNKNSVGLFAEIAEGVRLNKGLFIGSGIKNENNSKNKIKTKKRKNDFRKTVKFI